jgi:hypothetical protein
LPATFYHHLPHNLVIVVECSMSKLFAGKDCILQQRNIYWNACAIPFATINNKGSAN